MLEMIGWLGSIFLALCAVPQLIKSYNEGHADGLSWGLLSLWLIGEALTLVYVFPKADWPLIFNYGVNIALLLVIMKIKLGPFKLPQESYPDLDAEEFMLDDILKADWYHSIDGSGDRTLIFKPNDFAPGVWAGTEGWTFTKGTNQYKIVKIDLDNRTLIVTLVKGMERYQ